MECLGMLALLVQAEHSAAFYRLQVNTRHEINLTPLMKLLKSKHEHSQFLRDRGPIPRNTPYFGLSRKWGRSFLSHNSLLIKKKDPLNPLIMNKQISIRLNRQKILKLDPHWVIIDEGCLFSLESKIQQSGMMSND